jgi:hypothetical protein
MSDIEKDLKNSAGDYVYSVSKGIVSSVPVAGSAISEILFSVISSPIEKRKNEWMIRLSESLFELTKKVDNFNINNLSDNELFITIVSQATQIALRNHRQEKLMALRNAIINTALNIKIAEIEQTTFIQLVDELNILHLRILLFFKNPSQWFIDNNVRRPNIIMGSPLSILEIAYSDFSDNQLTNRLIKDLYNRGLFSTDSLGGIMTESGIYASRLTEYGQRFLNYITIND